VHAQGAFRRSDRENVSSAVHPAGDGVHEHRYAFRRAVQAVKGAVSLSGYAGELASNGAARVEWHGGSSLDAKELMRAPLEEEEKSALEEALEFLKDELSEGPMAAKQIKLNAKAEGVSERTLNRAKARLKVRSTKETYGWTWTMPETSGNQDARGSDPGNLAGAENDNGRDPACSTQDCQGCQHCQGGEHEIREKGDGNRDGWLNHPLDCECADCLYGLRTKDSK